MPYLDYKQRKTFRGNDKWPESTNVHGYFRYDIKTELPILVSSRQGEWLEENMTPLCYSRYESCDARRNNSVANSRGEATDTKPKVSFWLAAQKDAHTYVPKRHRIMGVHTSNLKGRKSSTVQSHSLQPLSRENDCDFLNHNLPFRGSRRKRMHSKVTSLPPVHVDAMMFKRRHTKNSDRASNDEEKLNQAIFGEFRKRRL